MAAGFKGLGLRALRYDPTSRVPGSNFSILDAKSHFWSIILAFPKKILDK